MTPMQELRELEAWLTSMSPAEDAEFQREMELETARIVQDSPRMPPGTRDEVLAEAYRLAQADAMLRIFRRNRVA